LGGAWRFFLTTTVMLILTLVLVGCWRDALEMPTVTPLPAEAATATRRPTGVPVPSPTPTVTTTSRPTDTPASPASRTPTATSSPAATITPKPSPTLTVTLVPSRSPLSPEEGATLEAIADEIEQLRGLDSDAPLALALMTPEQARDWLVEELEQGYSPEEARRDAQVYAALELLPPDTDLYALSLELYSEQVVGFYDSDANQMTVIDDETGLDAMDRIVFAHEYTHDLQDQFLGFDDLQAYRETAENEDIVRAVTALVEGDAQVTTLLYLFNHLGELDPSALGAIQTDQFAAAPPVLREELIFPYMAGLTFVQALRGQGGWEAVNAAYDAPPQSTEQILHPEKYLSREVPLAVSLEPLTSTLGTGWHLVKENTLGEFLLSLYLEVHLPREVATDASAGWDGDRFALYGRPKGGETLLLIVTVWDSGGEAAEFASAYGVFAEEKYGQSASGKDLLGTWWQGERDVTLLSTDGEVIIIVIGPEVNLIQRVWQVLEETLSVEP
jgi:hypothetical protein